LRFLTTRLTELSDDPSPLLRRKAATSEDKTEDNTQKATAPAEADREAEAKTDTKEVDSGDSAEA